MTDPSPAPSGARPRRATFADAAEIEAFVETLRRFERGELDAEQWRLYRVQRGVYGQRQAGVHMLRVKLPQGALEAGQLRALAEVATRFSRAFGHVTTRQNLQLHHVRPADLEPAMRRLAEAGLTTSGACGNTVRNVVACPLAGVAADEAFDVSPFAEAVTRHLLRHPLGDALPRKFKIAFEGCARDHVATPVHDLGFRARLGPGGRRGFAVTAAGGTATACASGALLVPFLPAAEVLALCEAVIRVFHAHGDRANRKRNRLKYLVRALGQERFAALVEEARAAVRRAGAPPLPFDPDSPPEEGPPWRRRPAPPSPAALATRLAAAPPRGPGEPPVVRSALRVTPAELARFRATQVRPQRQGGWSAVTVRLPQGDVTAAQLEALADLSLAYGDGAVRLGNGGHLLLRWVRDEDVPALHARLAAAGLAEDGAGSAADVVACPGAEVCALAVTGTRAHAAAIEAEVRARLGDRGVTAPLPIHVSGCPNGCSQHHLAAIGLQGSLRRLGDRAVPQFFVLLGGGAGEGGATFGRLAAKIPARRLPEAVARLAALHLAERRDGEEAGAFFARSFERARAAIADLEPLRPEDAAPEDLAPDAAGEEPGGAPEAARTAAP